MQAGKKLSIGGAIGVAISLIGAGIQWRWPEQRWLGLVFIVLGVIIAGVAIVATIVRSLTIKEYERQRPSGASVTPERLTQTGISNAPHNEFTPPQCI